MPSQLYRGGLFLKRLLVYGALGILPGALIFATAALNSVPRYNPLGERASRITRDERSEKTQKAVLIPSGDKHIDPAYKMVNKKVSLGNYAPDNLVKFQGVMVSKRIVPDLKRLLAAAKKDGLTLRVQSGYRSYERQQQVYNSWIAKEMVKNRSLSRSEAIKLTDRYSARPGHSEHQLGTTVDILSAENGYKFSEDRRWKYVGWLERNAQRFNFKISYGPDSREYQYEPWHIRWYPKAR